MEAIQSPRYEPLNSVLLLLLLLGNDFPSRFQKELLIALPNAKYVMCRFES